MTNDTLLGATSCPPRRPTSRPRLLAGVAPAVLAMLASGLASDPASAAARPDLTVSAVRVPSARAVPGRAFPVRLTVGNRGKAQARRSTARIVASDDARAGGGDHVLAKATVRPLRPRQRRRVVVMVTVAAGAPVHLVACADSRRRIREARERNNCRASSPVTVVAAGGTPAPAPTPAPVPKPAPPASMDADGDGTVDGADCAPFEPGIHPGAPDAPDDAFADSNCDGIDGDAAKSVFVAPGGSDGAADTRTEPMATIGAAIQKAQGLKRSSVLVRAGTYLERVVLANGIGVYGAYAPDWTRSGPPAPARSPRGRGADAQRAPGRGARCPGAHEPSDRSGAVREREDGRGPPRARLRQARHPLADRPAAGARRG